jgi:hypothetical protein
MLLDALVLQTSMCVYRNSRLAVTPPQLAEMPENTGDPYCDLWGTK